MTRLLAQLRRVPLPRLAALAAVAAGVLLVLIATARATVWAPGATTVVRVAGQSGAPVVVTTPEALALDGPSVRVDVRAADPNTPVFVGVGRAGDVEAYLGQAARAEITGVRGSDAVVSRSGGDTALPAPGGVDVWALSATGRGSASLIWPQAPGRWRVLAATDGSAPPSAVVLTWQRDRGSSAVPVLFAVGGLLLVLGLVAFRFTRPGTPAVRGARRSRGRDTADLTSPATPAIGAHSDAHSGAHVIPGEAYDRDDDERDEDDRDDDGRDVPAPFRQERRR